MECRDVHRALYAYVDDELGPEDAASVRLHLAECARCSRRLADLESLGRLVRTSPYYAAPSRLLARIAGLRASERGMPRPFPLVAALAVLALVAASALFAAWLISGTRVRQADAIEARVQEVLSSHVRALMGDHLLDIASSDRHTVRPWFLGKLDYSPPIRDLDAIGFPLLGGRLDYLDGRPVAAIVYGRRRHAINLFVWPESSTAAPVTRSLRGFQLRAWTREGTRFWAVSDLNDKELGEFALALQR